MNKRVIKVFIIAIFIIFSVIITNKITTSKQKLVYNYDNSFHDEFYFEGNYVVFKTYVEIQNKSRNYYNFYMYADVREDQGLVVEDFAAAYEEELLIKKRLFIESNSVNTYKVYFKALKGNLETKQNRLPPESIRFEIVD